ncbi:MAG: NAD(P)H-hydrate epimerase [Clostridiales bacterium]|nr:NAD(P)H-hydrate epimerase [Clostridiales bacterium]
MTVLSAPLNIRQEKEKDHRNVEILIREAFWNHHNPGCDEHYFAHVLRTQEVFVKELSLVAETEEGTLAGVVMGTKAEILCDDDTVHPVLCLGPLAVHPAFQRLGVGEDLLNSFGEKALELGYDTVILYGNPLYYTKKGFRDGKRYGIREAGGYHGALLVRELVPGALKGKCGTFRELYEYTPTDEVVAAFDALFPAKEKEFRDSQDAFMLSVQTPGYSVLSSAEMKEMEALSDANGVSYEQLMENAGTAAAEAICRMVKQDGVEYKDIGVKYLAEGRKLLILAGKGNNAGDGFVIARLLANRGFSVQIALLCGTKFSPLASLNLQRLGKIVQPENLPAAIFEADIIVDGVFGTGFHGALSPDLQEVFALANKASALRIALDIPSGMNCDTGEASANTFKADHTLCFGAYKHCMLMLPCQPYLGRWKCLEIGLVEPFMTE